MSDRTGFFPSSTRVIYTDSPLVEVICQLRFPTILRVASGIPDEFQECLRNRFPLYHRETTEVPSDLPAPIAEILTQTIGAKVSHVFQTEDGDYRLTLSADAIALTCYKYTRWEDFRENLDLGFSTLINVYKPSFFSRIGLRYRNALPLISGSWEDLISTNIGAELRKSNLSADVIESHTAIRIGGKNGKGVLLQHGIGKMSKTETPAYLIDIDCYGDQKIGVDDALDALFDFNITARHGFRWCISDGVHDRLGPVEPPEVDKNGTR